MFKFGYSQPNYHDDQIVRTIAYPSVGSDPWTSRKHHSGPPADPAAACRNWLPWRDAHCKHDKEGWNHQEPGGRDVDITSQ